MSTNAPPHESQQKSMSRGLDSSIWASENHDNVSSSHRYADWLCVTCNFANFNWRVACMRCGLPKASTYRDHSVGPDNSESIQEQSGAPSTQLMTPELDEALKKSGGLSTSRWATSTYNTRLNNLGREQIQSQLQINPSLKNRHNFLAAPTARPNLCLPYEVQHFILSMMERIVEEGCFEFAARWNPEAMIQNDWTCAEAVEVSTWRSFFLTSIPPEAIPYTSLHDFKDAMANVVRLRNAAVHRHLCDNVEIRRMAVNAQGLMTIFSDVTRHGKFVRLETELREWDNGFQQDPAEQRLKLEVALLEISERPLDTMDWTPIRELIQDITPTVLENSAVNSFSYEMDVD